METDSNHDFSSGNANGGSAGLDKHRLDPNAQAAVQPRPTATNNDEGTVTSPTTSPPYWVQSHHRSFSNISVETITEGAITLQDNTDGEDSKNKACWAKSVYIEDYVIVNGSRTNIGAFVTWNITVETLQVLSELSFRDIVADGNRADRCEFEKDIPSSMTFKNDF